MHRDFENATAVVEGAIRKVGLDPATCRVTTESGESVAGLKRGSASVLVSVAQHDFSGHARAFLRVISPVVGLPEDAAKQVALLRRLLELNAGGLANAAFGLIGDRVVAVSERPAAGLDEDEAEQIVKHLSAVADTFDDRLAIEFGATKA